MRYIKLNPMEYPLKKGESWYLTHPNNKNCEFKVPQGGVTLCMNSLFDFTAGRIYEISDNDPDNGWITVACKETVVKMPYYVFARYFDAECFVRGTFSVEGKKVEPFDYKNTVPMKHSKLERFEDKE